MLKIIDAEVMIGRECFTQLSGTAYLSGDIRGCCKPWFVIHIYHTKQSRSYKQWFAVEKLSRQTAPRFVLSGDEDHD